uniref:RHS repeat domain-containing protein n=1 Tax=unclassified Streptomyces TaxID=2593676 RepID=UPI001F543DC0|nr:MULTISPECIES: RHS repeat domain-containing protein [unclassified Streptomyces]
MISRHKTETLRDHELSERRCTYTRDAAGQITVRTNALGEALAYKRDALGRVVSKDAAGAVTTYAYDRAGRMIRATGPDSELIYQYDRRGLVKTGSPVASVGR